ncbi:hypothetical protein [Aestuariivirga sp.]|uniref:hypothetical protein n=1 Tax=Aestuariivirga sp. TaxID=2650926 RepID=UPI0035B39959
MSIFIAVIVAVVVLGWWLNRRWVAAERRRAEEARDHEPPGQARAHEIAKAQAELTRWSGPQ